MARDRAKINTGIWGDADWKSLTMAEQWLYTTILTRPELNHVGVGDWRPRRISKLLTGATVEQVEEAAQGLESKLFILLDEDTEEVLIRSFLKHDGVLDNPNLGASIKGAYDSVYSPELQQVVVHELRRITDRQPDVPVLKSEKSRKHIESLMKLPTLSATAFIERKNGVKETPTTAYTTAYTTPSPTAFETGAPSTTTTTTTTSLSKESERGSGGKSRSKPSTAIPANWEPTAAHEKKAHEQGVDLAGEAERFKLHAETHDRKCVNWNSAFTMWLSKARPEKGQQHYMNSAEKKVDVARHWLSQPAQAAPHDPWAIDTNQRKEIGA